MSTETFGTKPVVIVADKMSEALNKKFTNGSGGALTEGQEVILNTDGTVGLRDNGTIAPLGIVTKGGANGETVVVQVFCIAILNANAKTDLNAGDLVTSSGSTVDGLPEYKAAAKFDFATGIALENADGAASVIRIGIFYAPVSLAADLGSDL